MRSIFAILLSGFALCSTGYAAGAYGMINHPSYQDNKSQATQKLFVEFCARYTLAPSKWADVVASEKLKRAHPQLEARLLSGTKGAVYLIPSQSLGFFALSTRSDGTCSVTTWRAQQVQFTSAFLETAPFYAAQFGPASVDPGHGAISIALPDGRTMTANMAVRPDTAETREVTFTMAITRGAPAPRPNVLMVSAERKIRKPAVRTPVLVADAPTGLAAGRPRPPVSSTAPMHPILPATIAMLRAAPLL